MLIVCTCSLGALRYQVKIEHLKIKHTYCKKVQVLSVFMKWMGPSGQNAIRRFIITTVWQDPLFIEAYCLQK